jgi:hypothetical protein
MGRTRRSLETVAIAAAIGSCIGLSNPAFAQSTPAPAEGSVILPAPEPPFGGLIRGGHYGQLSCEPHQQAEP